jgi:IS30 family transposase
MDLAFWEGKSILTAININSRLVFAKLLRNKGAATVLNGIKKLVDAYKVDILTTDNGKEFLNCKATTYLKSKDITHFNNEPGATLQWVRLNASIEQSK